MSATACSSARLPRASPAHVPESEVPGLLLPIRPVLKHGPRSLTCARVIDTLYEGQRQNESEG